MKFLIIVTILIFGTVPAVYGASTQIDNNPLFATPANKNEIRVELKNALSRLICADKGHCCPYELTPDQNAFAIAKVIELGKCINTTVDRFIDLVDDDIVRSDFRNVDNIRKYVGPICQVFDNAFECVRNVEPALDMCLSERETVYKNKIFQIVPLMHSSLCLKNGSLVADIVEHADGLHCLAVTAYWIGRSGASQLLFRNTTELFGSENDCREFNTVRQDTNVQLGQCSPTVLSMIAEISSRFCEGTKCNRFISDWACY